MTNLIDRYVELSVKYAREYAERSMSRILDSLPQGADRNTSELIIHQLYVKCGEQFSDAYAQVFQTHLKAQFLEKSKNGQPLLICFSGPFGSGKTTLQNLLDSGEAPEVLKNLEAVQLYLGSTPFKFDFKWAWNSTKVYNPEDHAATFAYARAAGAGSKDAAMQLAVENGVDLLYPSSLTPHVSDGPETLQNELNRLQGYRDKGYKFVLIGCAANSETCLARVAQRDRKPTDSEVFKSVEGFSQNFQKFCEIADAAILLDTGLYNSDYSVISQKSEGRFEVVDGYKFSYLEILC